MDFERNHCIRAGQGQHSVRGSWPSPLHLANKNTVEGPFEKRGFDGGSRRAISGACGFRVFGFSSVSSIGHLCSCAVLLNKVKYSREIGEKGILTVAEE